MEITGLRIYIDPYIFLDTKPRTSEYTGVFCGDTGLHIYIDSEIFLDTKPRTPEYIGVFCGDYRAPYGEIRLFSGYRPLYIPGHKT